MNKFAKRMTGAFVGLAMAVGVGVTIGVGSKKAVAVDAASGSWDLTAASYDSASKEQVVFSNTGATVVVSKNGGTDANNYLGGTNAHTRWYNGNLMTVTPKDGYQINSFSITATSAGYQKWTAGSNCTGSTSAATLTVTPATKTAAFTLSSSATGRYTSLTVNYEAASVDPITYSAVAISEKTPLTGTYKGDAYYECEAEVTGTGAFSSAVTWSITNADTYGAGKTIANKASIDDDGKITFLDNCTVYAWATAADGQTHNASGFVVAASGLKDNPISTWTKITDTGNVSVSKVYALSNDGTLFGENSVSSNAIPLTSSLSSIGFVSLESTTGGYYVRFATETADVWSADGKYIKWANDSTKLSSTNDPDSSYGVWTLVENSNNGVYLKNVGSNRHLGLNGSTEIKAYAASNLASNAPVYLYEAGSLPVVECSLIELKGAPASDMSIGDTVVLGYSALDGEANDWTGDVKYTISNESTSGVVELSATSGAQVTLTAKKAGTATVSVQDAAEKADPDSVTITVLADPERIELPVGSYTVTIDASEEESSSVPETRDYEIKAKDGRTWYQNLTVAFSNITVNTGYKEYVSAKTNGALTVTNHSNAKISNVEIHYYKFENEGVGLYIGDDILEPTSSTGTSGSDNDLYRGYANVEGNTFALKNKNSQYDSKYYTVTITLTVVDESEEFLNLTIDKGATATSFTEGDAPSNQGLTVYENYSTDGETISRSEDVTSSAEWSYSIAKIAADTTSYTVTATYGGHTSAAVTVDGFTVTALSKYSRVQSQDELFDGQVVILAVAGTHNKTVASMGNNILTVQDASFLGEKIASNNEMEFVVRMYGDQFALQNGTKFLNYQGTSNAIYLSEETLDSTAAKCGWTLDNTGLHSEGGDRYLKYNSGNPRFACYADTTDYQVVQLYKSDASVMSAQNKADTFLYRELHLRDISTSDHTEGTACKGNSGYYATAKAAFTAESFADARSLVLANQDAVARLSAWARANSETFNPNTGVFSALSTGMPGVAKVESRSVITTMVIVSMVGVAAAGGLFFYRKRRVI